MSQKEGNAIDTLNCGEEGLLEVFQDRRMDRTEPHFRHMMHELERFPNKLPSVRLAFRSAHVLCSRACLRIYVRVEKRVVGQCVWLESLHRA
jgi:hypothetical protein